MSEESKPTRSIFDLESEDMGKPLDKLDEYLRVSTPGKWLFFFALALLALALVVWGFWGTIPVNMTFKGVGISKTDVRALSSAGEIEVSEVIFLVNPMEVSSKVLDNKKAQVAFSDGTKCSATTHLLDTSVMTKDEIRGMLEKHSVDSAWVLSQLDTGEYSYMLLAAMDTPLNYLYWRETCSVSVTTSEVHPISLLFDS